MTNFVTIDTDKNKILLKNLFSVVGAFGCIWIIFHLSAVFFFGFILGSPLLIGFFLGIGNLWAMFIDVPMGTLQKYFRSKHLITTACICIILASLIFAYFIISAEKIEFNFNGEIFETAKQFFGNIINLILLLLVGLLYGTAKEMYDVSNLSYMLAHIDPSEYGKNLSKNNIATGVGSLFGMILSIIILSFKNSSLLFVILALIVLVIGVIIFIQMYFDNPDREVRLQDMKNLRVTQPKIDADKIKQYTDYTIHKVQTADFAKVADNAKYVFLKPVEIKENINMRELIDDTKREFGSLFKMVINKETRVQRIIWLVTTVLLFGFWDTIVVTFLVDFFNESLKHAGADNVIRSGFILIGMLAIPVFTLQIPFIKLAKKVGYHKIIAVGLAISGVALWGFSTSVSPGIVGLVIIMCFGLLNSTGYAAGMPLAQSIFAENYNEQFAKNNNLKEINAHASAGPLKILINFANSIGLFIGGTLITIFGFGGLFKIYALIILAWFALTIIKKKEWDL